VLDGVKGDADANRATKRNDGIVVTAHFSYQNASNSSLAVLLAAKIQDSEPVKDSQANDLLRDRATAENHVCSGRNSKIEMSFQLGV
jgi:hypothetical protein